MENKMKTIGVLMTSLVDSYQQDIINGIKIQAEKYNIKLLFFIGPPISSKPDKKIDISVYSLINEDELDLIIIIGGSLGIFIGGIGLRDYLNKWKSIPKISIGIEIPGIPSMLVNNFYGIDSLLDHLIIDHHYKKIAVLSGPLSNEEASIRFEAYKASLKKHDIIYKKELVVHGNFAPGDGIMVIKELIDTRKQEFDVLLCEDDASALEVLQELNERGLSAPDDYVIVGFDDIDISQYSNPPLTTVRQPLYFMGLYSIKAALKIFSGETLDEKIFIPTTTVIRDSCGCSSKQNTDDNKKFIDHIKDEKPIKNIVNDFEKMISEIDESSINEKDEVIMYEKEKIYYYKKIIIISILNLIKNNSDEQLFNDFYELLRQTSNFGWNSKFWLNLLAPYFEENSFDLNTQFIWNTITIKFIQAENHLRGINQLTESHLTSQYNDMSEQFTNCFETKALKKFIRQSLPAIQIRTMFIYIYEEDTSKAKLLLYHGSPDYKKYENKIYNTRDLVPKDIKKLQKQSFIILPLQSEHTKLGYTVIEFGTSPKHFYNNFVDRISRSLEVMALMKRINDYAKTLESQVVERTQQLQEANNKLKDLSFQDPLSGLHNRRFMQEVISPEAAKLILSMEYSIKYSNRRNIKENKVFALFMIDIDFFKEVNDTYGHDAGDMMIKQISEILEKQCRMADFVIRFGGEEFVVVLRQFNPKFLAVKAEQIRKAVEDHDFELANNITIKKTCSVGCLTLPPKTDFPNAFTFNETLILIDKALYYAKENGRNRSIYIKCSEELFLNSEDLRNVIPKFDEFINKGIIEFVDAAEGS